MLKQLRFLPVFFAVAIALQYAGGAYGTELSGYPDEAAHFVTGVMVRDYLSTFPPAPIVPFLKEFYIHYPRVAIGHWPPVLYLIEGVWFLLFHPSRISVLLLMALISAASATTVHHIVAKGYGVWPGALGGLFFLLLPITQTLTQEVMSDVLVGLFGLWAVLAFARFLESQRWSDANWFALWAILAIFTKNSGLYLALLPPLALLFSGRLRLLRSVKFWWPALLVGVPVAAWLAVSARFVFSTWSEPLTVSFVGRALLTNAKFLFSIFGIAFAILICAGLFRKILQPAWSALAAAAVGVYLFQSAIPAGLEPRFLAPAVPLLIPFVFAGAHWSRWPRLALTGAATLFAIQTFTIPQKPHRGFSEAADLILPRLPSKDAGILVSSESDGEGLLISEIAMRQPHPQAFVLRASKMLSRADWLARDYQARFQTDAEVMDYLESLPVDFLVIDQQSGQQPLLHHRQLLEIVQQNPDHWHAAGSAAEVRIYERLGPPGRPSENIHREMERIIDRTLNH